MYLPHHSEARHAAALEQHTDLLRALQESLDVKDTVLGAAISQQSQLAARVVVAEAEVHAKQGALEDAQAQMAHLEEQLNKVGSCCGLARLVPEQYN